MTSCTTRDKNFSLYDFATLSCSRWSGIRSMIDSRGRSFGNCSSSICSSADAFTTALNTSIRMHGSSCASHLFPELDHFVDRNPPLVQRLLTLLQPVTELPPCRKMLPFKHAPYPLVVEGASGALLTGVAQWAFILEHGHAPSE